MDKPPYRNKLGQSEAEFLAGYDAGRYQRPSVTVDMLIFTIGDQKTDNYRKLPGKKLKILMIKRANHPFGGQWALPGGFIHMDENLEDAAYRELAEETNIKNIYMEQLYTWGEINRDPRTRVISCAYMALVNSSAVNIVAGEEAEAAAWFFLSHQLVQEQKTLLPQGYILTRLVRLDLSNEIDRHYALVNVEKKVEGSNLHFTREVVESSGIAFDHARMIEYAVERLQNKIEYTDIAFNLMPPLFTLTELQQVYEIILDRELLKANFRRKVINMVIETNQLTHDAGHRPSKLYRFNPDWNQKTFE